MVFFETEVIQNVQIGYTSQKVEGVAKDALNKIYKVIWNTPGAGFAPTYNEGGPHIISVFPPQHTVFTWFCIGIIGLVMSGALVACIINSKKNIRELEDKNAYAPF